MSRFLGFVVHLLPFDKQQALDRLRMSICRPGYLSEYGWAARAKDGLHAQLNLRKKGL